MKKIARFSKKLGELLKEHNMSSNPGDMHWKAENDLLEAFVPEKEWGLSCTYISIYCMMPFVQPDDAKTTVRMDDGKYPIYAIVRSCGLEVVAEADYIEWTDTLQSFRMLSYSTGIKTMEIADIDFSKCTSFSYMFANNRDVEEIHFHNIKGMENVRDTYSMFLCCCKLASLNMSCFQGLHPEYAESMFSACYSLKRIDDIFQVDAKCYNTSAMFRDCLSLEELDLNGWNVSGVSNMALMFYSCNSLKALDVHQFDPSHCKDMRLMFAHCSSLMILDTSGWKISKECNTEDIIAECESLVLVDKILQ